MHNLRIAQCFFLSLICSILQICPFVWWCSVVSRLCYIGGVASKCQRKTASVVESVCVCAHRYRQKGLQQSAIISRKILSSGNRQQSFQVDNFLLQSQQDHFRCPQIGSSQPAGATAVYLFIYYIIEALRANRNGVGLVGSTVGFLSGGDPI